MALDPAYSSHPDHAALYSNQALELLSDDTIKLLNTSFCLFAKDSNFVTFTTCKTNKSLSKYDTKTRQIKDTSTNECWVHTRPWMEDSNPML